jgi:1-acyl-sn-glycerol-3-phosphate acyltransferase
MKFLETFSPDRSVAEDFWKLLGLNAKVQNPERVPASTPLLIVSNHRSFLDPLLLVSCLGIPINFVCHRYMGNVPILREVLQTFGAFPFTDANTSPGGDPPGDKLRQREWQQNMLLDARRLLKQGNAVGIFPEGAAPMLNTVAPKHLSSFYRGFAHLALQADVPNLQILPVGIAATTETRLPLVPLSLLHYIDPSEPLFKQDGWHPAVFYQDVEIRVGHPFAIDVYQDRYYGKQAGVVARDLTQFLADEVTHLVN